MPSCRVIRSRGRDVFMWLKNHWLLSVLGAFVLGLGGAGAGLLIFADGRLGQLDSAIREGQSTIRGLTDLNSQLKASNSELTSRLNRLTSGITEAARLAGRQYDQTGDIIQELRGVIGTLQALKIKLTALADGK